MAPSTVLARVSDTTSAHILDQNYSQGPKRVDHQGAGEWNLSHV